ncbi:MAG: type II toxin-antitoxin system VapC family toxin [Candidatus Hodarchaeales archaeon]
MPFIETDMLFGFLNSKDSHHEVATEILMKLGSDLKLSLPSSVLLEMELIYKSEGREEDLIAHMSNLLSIEGLNITALTPETILLAISLQKEYGLSFFDSHHVSSSLQGDGIIISTDQAFKSIEGLELIDPYDFAATLNKKT